MKCDPRPLFSQPESEQTREPAWDELWEELHHQGDVGEASYASVAHLVRIHRTGVVVDWNTLPRTRLGSTLARMDRLSR
jgi:hypothetical protein